MKVLIDTSVWADFFNGFASPQEKDLARLLAGDDEICTCGVVVSEVFQGLRREKGRAEVERLFRELVFLEPSGIDTYLRAANVYRTLRRRGVTVRSTIDCLIAVIADENDCDVLSRDRDLGAILGAGLVRVRPWPGALR
ncbi:MAG TPA: PIN domain-containing protein [Thermoanaerobaculia bacterium]|nr:PIN domain-containing protein [Thermoanaerobaculia bacterium]